MQAPLAVVALGQLVGPNAIGRLRGTQFKHLFIVCLVFLLVLRTGMGLHQFGGGSTGPENRLFHFDLHENIFWLKQAISSGISAAI